MDGTTESEDLAGLFAATAGRASCYLDGLADRHVLPTPEALASLQLLRGDMPSEGLPTHQVIAELDELGSPATVASAAGRYFGLVIGGALPATVAASWLATAWDQNAVFRWTSPVAATLEEVSLDWLIELLNLPKGSAGAFVSGASMATLTALAAARHALLARAGWDVEAQGLFGAPELRVIVGDEVHVTVLKALALLGLGRERLERVPVDDQGRMRIDALLPLDARSIVCIQAGNVNTGAFEPLPHEPVYSKQVNSAFIGTKLERDLRAAGIDTLVVVGLTTNHCVSTSVRMAANLGFRTLVAADATAAFAQWGWDGRSRSAEEVHGGALGDLTGEFAEIVDTAAIIRAVAPGE